MFGNVTPFWRVETSEQTVVTSGRNFALSGPIEYLYFLISNINNTLQHFFRIQLSTVGAFGHTIALNFCTKPPSSTLTTEYDTQILSYGGDPTSGQSGQGTMVLNAKKVGIDQKSPLYTLDVNGTINCNKIRTAEVDGTLDLIVNTLRVGTGYNKPSPGNIAVTENITVGNSLVTNLIRPENVPYIQFLNTNNNAKCDIKCKSVWADGEIYASNFLQGERASFFIRTKAQNIEQVPQIRGNIYFEDDTGYECHIFAGEITCSNGISCGDITIGETNTISTNTIIPRTSNSDISFLSAKSSTSKANINCGKITSSGSISSTGSVSASSFSSSDNGGLSLGTGSITCGDISMGPSLSSTSALFTNFIITRHPTVDTIVLKRGKEDNAVKANIKCNKVNADNEIICDSFEAGDVEINRSLTLGSLCPLQSSNTITANSFSTNNNGGLTLGTGTITCGSINSSGTITGKIDATEITAGTNAFTTQKIKMTSIGSLVFDNLGITDGHLFTMSSGEMFLDFFNEFTIRRNTNKVNPVLTTAMKFTSTGVNVANGNISCSNGSVSASSFASSNNGGLSLGTGAITCGGITSTSITTGSTDKASLTSSGRLDFDSTGFTGSFFTNSTGMFLDFFTTMEIRRFINKSIPTLTSVVQINSSGFNVGNGSLSCSSGRLSSSGSNSGLYIDNDGNGIITNGNGYNFYVGRKTSDFPTSTRGNAGIEIAWGKKTFGQTQLLNYATNQTGGFEFMNVTSTSNPAVIASITPTQANFPNATVKANYFSNNNADFLFIPDALSIGYRYGITETMSVQKLADEILQSASFVFPSAGVFLVEGYLRLEFNSPNSGTFKANIRLGLTNSLASGSVFQDSYFPVSQVVYDSGDALQVHNIQYQKVVYITPATKGTYWMVATMSSKEWFAKEISFTYTKLA